MIVVGWLLLPTLEGALKPLNPAGARWKFGCVPLPDDLRLPEGECRIPLIVRRGLPWRGMDPVHFPRLLQLTELPLVTLPQK